MGHSKGRAADRSVPVVFLNEGQETADTLSVNLSDVLRRGASMTAVVLLVALLVLGHRGRDERVVRKNDENYIGRILVPEQRHHAEHPSGVLPARPGHDDIDHHDHHDQAARLLMMIPTTPND